MLQSLDYFKSCHSANVKLDQLENQFRDFDVHQNKTGSQMSLLEKSLEQLDQIMMEVLGKGNSLIGGVGDKVEGTVGIKESMLKLENRAHNLRSNYQSNLQERNWTHKSIINAHCSGNHGGSEGGRLKCLFLFDSLHKQ